MDELRKKETFYEYWDETNQEVYSCGWIEQQYGLPVFRKLEYDKVTQVVILEGFMTVTGYPSDTLTLGYCPFTILVAEADSGNLLHKVRKLTVTQCQDDTPNSKDGFFSVRFKVNPKDIMIIGNPGRQGAGAIVYNISALLERE